MKTKRKAIYLSLALMAGTPALGVMADTPAMPGILNADDTGYLSRAKRMMHAGNTLGAIHQFGRISTESIPLSEEESKEMLYLLGEAYYQTGDPQCLTILDDFVAQYPADNKAITAQLMRGDFYFFAHDFPAALQIYNSMAGYSLDKSSDALYTYRRALSMVECGFFKEARPLFAKIKGNKAYSNLALYYDAYLDYVDGKQDDALAKFLKVKEGKDIYPQYYITQIYFDKGEWKKSVDVGAPLLRSNLAPQLLQPTRRGVGVGYYQLGDRAKAEPLLAAYCKEMGEDAADDAVYALATYRYEEGKYEEARTLFGRLTDRRNALAQSSLLYLGQIEAAEGNDAAALLYFERACNVNFDAKVAETALYDYVAARTRGANIPFDTSINLLQQFLDTYPDSKYAPEIDRQIAQAWLQQGDYANALSAIRRIKRPDHETLALKQIILYGAGADGVTRGNYSEAATLLDEALAISGGEVPLRAQTQIWLGDARYHLGQYAAAEKAYSSALSSGYAGGSARLAEYDLAYCQLLQGKYAAALKNFQSVVKSGKRLPSDIVADARVQIADCKYYLGKYSESLSDYNALGKEGIARDQAAYRKALILGIQGDTAGKIKILDGFATDFPESALLRKALGELADTYNAQGNLTKANYVYETLIAKYDDAAQSADMYYNLANNYLQQGDKTKALEAYRTLESIGGSQYHADAFVGIMRSTDNPTEQLDYARRVIGEGGLPYDVLEEAYFIDGVSKLDSRNNAVSLEGAETLSQLAENPQSLWGAKSAVMLAQHYLDKGDYATAAKMMEDFTASGTGQQYWLARGFILLADAYTARGDKALAEEYLRSLKRNYPGRELDIQDMISRRL